MVKVCQSQSYCTLSRFQVKMEVCPSARLCTTVQWLTATKQTVFRSVLPVDFSQFSDVEWAKVLHWGMSLWLVLRRCVPGEGPGFLLQIEMSLVVQIGVEECAHHHHWLFKMQSLIISHYHMLIYMICILYILYTVYHRLCKMVMKPGKRCSSFLCALHMCLRCTLTSLSPLYGRRSLLRLLIEHEETNVTGTRGRQWPWQFCIILP